jgi:putative ABC transport system ATP-binding protein
MGTGENPKHSPYSPALTPTLWISVEGKQPTDRAMLGQAKPSAPVPSPPPETPGVFHAEQLTKTYRMGDVEVQALRSVDLDLYEGEFVVLLGPSGSGKSTLLNILGGLDIPTSGQVIFRNQNLTQATERRLTQFRRESVGFIFQFYNLIPSLTARENVALVTEIARRPLSPEAALEIVGLRDRLDHFPAQLSGGEQQRVAIARAIAKRPEVLLCDEPTGALDFRTGKLVLKALQQVNQEFGTTTAVITHNAGIAAMADRVIHMRSGAISTIEHNAEKTDPDQLEW